MADSTAAELLGPLARLRKRILSRELTQVGGDVHNDLVAIKRQSRNLHEAAHTAKENVAALKKQSDVAHLALQSVKYERRHLEKELSDTLATKIYDSVDFAVPQPRANPDPSVAMLDKLNRVKTEVNLRQEQSKKIKQLEVEVDAVRAEVTTLRNLLGGLPSKVSDLEKGMQSLERFLGMKSYSLQREMKEKISRAASPLIVLFSALESACNDLGDETVETSVQDEPEVNVILAFTDYGESFEFTYSNEVNVILVESSGSQDVLQSLYDETDVGEVLPETAKAPSGEITTLKGSLKRPYKWAQQLAGIGCSQTFNAKDFAIELILRVQGRMKAKAQQQSTSVDENPKSK